MCNRVAFLVNENIIPYIETFNAIAFIIMEIKKKLNK